MQKNAKLRIEAVDVTKISYSKPDGEKKRRKKKFCFFCDDSLQFSLFFYSAPGGVGNKRREKRVGDVYESSPV